MHEITHILGVNSLFFTRMYGSYTGSTFLTTAQTFASPSGNPTRNMLITSNVKTYVQTYFGCSDTSIGALIE